MVGKMFQKDCHQTLDFERSALQNIRRQQLITLSIFNLLLHCAGMFVQIARDNVQQTCAGDRQEMDKIEREREIDSDYEIRREKWQKQLCGSTKKVTIW